MRTKRDIKRLFHARKPRSLLGGAGKKEQKEYARLLAKHRSKERTPWQLTLYRQLAQLDKIENRNEREYRKIDFFLRKFCTQSTRKFFQGIMQAVYNPPKFDRANYLGFGKTIVDKARKEDPRHTKENLQRLVETIERTKKELYMASSKIVPLSNTVTYLKIDPKTRQRLPQVQ